MELLPMGLRCVELFKGCLVSLDLLNVSINVEEVSNIDIISMGMFMVFHGVALELGFKVPHGWTTVGSSSDIPVHVLGLGLDQGLVAIPLELGSTLGYIKLVLVGNTVELLHSGDCSGKEGATHRVWELVSSIYQIIVFTDLVKEEDDKGFISPTPCCSVLESSEELEDLLSCHLPCSVGSESLGKFTVDFLGVEVLGVVPDSLLSLVSQQLGFKQGMHPYLLFLE